MKVSTGCNVKKFVDLEGGDPPLEILVSKSLKTSRCFNIIKFIFYLEIILFIGLLGFMALQNYLERPKFVSSTAEGFDQSNDFNSDGFPSTTEDSSSINELKEHQDIYRSPILQEMTNKIQKLVDAIDKLSDNDNSDRELSKYREVFKPFLSGENSHEDYRSRVIDPVIISADGVSSSAESLQGFESVQKPEDYVIRSDLMTKSFPDLVDDIDDHEDAVLTLGDVLRLQGTGIPEPVDDSHLIKIFEIEKKDSSEESSAIPEEVPTISEDNGDLLGLVDDTEERGDDASRSSEVEVQESSVERSFGRLESITEDIVSKQHEVFGKIDDDSGQNEEQDSGQNEEQDSGKEEKYSFNEVVCGPDEVGVEKLRHLGVFLGFSVPDDWSDCVDADFAFDVLMEGSK